MQSEALNCLEGRTASRHCCGPRRCATPTPWPRRNAGSRREALDLLPTPPPPERQRAWPHVAAHAQLLREQPSSHASDCSCSILQWVHNAFGLMFCRPRRMPPPPRRRWAAGVWPPALPPWPHVPPRPSTAPRPRRPSPQTRACLPPAAPPPSAQMRASATRWAAQSADGGSGWWERLGVGRRRAVSSTAPVQQHVANQQQYPGPLVHLRYRTCCSPTSCCHNHASAWVDVSAAACALLSRPRPQSRSAAPFTRQPPSANVAWAAPAGRAVPPGAESNQQCTCWGNASTCTAAAMATLPCTLPSNAHLAPHRASCHCPQPPT